MKHASSCSIYNAPALPAGECDCLTHATEASARAVYDLIYPENDLGDENMPLFEYVGESVRERCHKIAAAILVARFGDEVTQE